MELNTVTSDKLVEIMNSFYEDESSEKSVSNMLETICAVCGVNRVSTMVRNNKTDEYLKAYEYDTKSGFVDLINKINMEAVDFVNVMHSEKNINFDKFENVFNGKKYIYSNDYSKYKDVLKSFGFVSGNDSKITDFYIFVVDTAPELFTYYVFENYSEEKISDAKIGLITMLCETINIRLKSVIRESKYKNDLLMRDVVLNSEEIPMVMLEKENKKVLMHNKFFRKWLPEVKVGKTSEELINIVDECMKDSNKDNTILVDDLNDEDDKQWLRKVIPFNLSTGNEAYMIYSKNITDYINQINAVDNLTKALLLRGFEEYYKNFVQRSNDNYILCSIDIDKFKYINSTFGYEFGDDVLKKVATVIDDFIDNEENFCRMGEDKFSILLRFDDDMQLHLKLRELSNRFENMRNKYFADTKITIIGGVTVVDKKLPLNTLLDQSTMARKSAKGSLRNTFSLYNVELDLKLQKEIQLEEQVPNAVLNDEFVAFLQPKFDLENKQICGAEALVRWITPKGMVFPDQFIPLFEKNGFILTLDFIIYEKVMKYIKKCIDEKLPVYPISVNVSRNHIKDKKFIDKFMNLVKKYKVPLEYLELEVTESVFVEDRKELKHFINDIKEQGLKVSIDDFGTAYSSLQTLTDINVDILKIDKGFLDNVAESGSKLVNKDEILLKNIINLAKELDFKVICEGVETDEQITFLKNMGCELGQGYVFARPMPISEYEEKFIKQ